MSASTKLLRLPQIIGNPKSSPAIPPIIPVCASAWWAGVKSGRYPKPIKLSPRVTAWREDEVLALIRGDAK
jgi:prophage regulatory protein